MAHHNSTPRSILDAPTRTVVVISPQIGLSRDERRNGIRWPALMTDDAKRWAIRDANAAGPNTPAVRTTPRRGRNVRRHAVTR